MDLKSFLNKKKTMTLLRKYMINDEQYHVLEYCNSQLTCKYCKYQVDTVDTPCTAITVLGHIKHSLIDNLINMSYADVEELLYVFNQE